MQKQARSEMKSNAKRVCRVLFNTLLFWWMAAPLGYPLLVLAICAAVIIAEYVYWRCFEKRPPSSADQIQKG
jgi:Flp pilus assembly protein TadB